MTFWVDFWTTMLIVSIAIFSLMAVVVTIGGFFNIISLFKTLGKEHQLGTTAPEDSAEEKA
jgi:hypothetical protein